MHWFCFGVGDYPLSAWLLNPSIYSFSPGVIAIGGMQICIALCDSFRLCICTLDLMSANDKLCNSYVSLNVTLVKIKLCNAFI